MKVSIEVSSVTARPPSVDLAAIISQRKVEHEIRLKEGEVSILGGLIQAYGHEDSEWLAGCGADSGDALPLLRG